MSRDLEPQIEHLSHRVIGAAIEVHRHIGPGQLEATYHRAMEIELNLCGVPFQSEAPVPITYKGNAISTGRIDLLIGDRDLVLELKAVDQLASIHDAQLIAYLKTVGAPLGILINFNVPLLKDGILRRANTRGKSYKPHTL
jgi:GxxExxY protein